MKHVRTITRKPALAVGEIPAGALLNFIIAILQAIGKLFVEKEGGTTA
jgi:hypothetical protein